MKFDRQQLKNIGYIRNKTDRILSKNKRRVNVKDSEADFAKAWNDPIYKHGNSTHLMNAFYNYNSKEKHPCKELPPNQNDIAEIILKDIKVK